MKRIALAGLLIALVCSALQAQTIAFKVVIPFNFEVGKKEMPAGMYVVRESNGLLSLQQVDGNHASVVVLSNAQQRMKQIENREVQFIRYGNTYFLRSVWTPESSIGRTLPVSPREKELASRGTPSALAGVTGIPR